MSTSSINNYKLNHKLHPLSLLAQLTSRHATGCLRVFTDTASWVINLDGGKLTYASYSDKLFERLDHQLRRFSQKIPHLNTATRIQMRLMFEPKAETQPIIYADYQAICWLVSQNHITSKQAAVLIEELAKEVIATFLLIKEGSYEFFPDNTWEELPKFCHLDLRLLVEHSQRQLRNRQRTQPSVNIGGSQLSTNQQVSPPTAKQNNQEVKYNSPQTSPPSLVRKTLYTIACIDDSPTVLNYIKSFLDENIFTVITVNDPVKALMQILRSKPDIILLDVEMPNLDGYELCSLLRRHSAFKNTPIIMVTGKTGFIDRAKAKIVRSSGYLTKPFNQSELLKMVFKHIG